MVPTATLVALQAVYFESQSDQILMKFRLEFEHVRADLFNRDTIPLICVWEIYRMRNNDYPLK